MTHYDPAIDSLLLFDGVCHLCNGGVQFIVKIDPHARIKFTPIQSALGQQLYVRHGLDPAVLPSLLYITPSGAFTSSTAAIEIARTLGGLWSVAVLFKAIPRPLRDAAYTFVASRRYQWFGKHETCIMPTPALKARLVDG
jgi:predicted DCC family thiol-disulfide oxidoreductase YuxK